MYPEQETQAAEHLLTRYAHALTTTDAAALPTFYTADGLFLPAGSKPLPARTLPASATVFFSKGRFHLRYSAPQVTVDGNYAFVQATAHTTTTALTSGRAEHRTSRDFFVLRREAQAWRIFRYLFQPEQVA